MCRSAMRSCSGSACALQSSCAVSVASCFVGRLDAMRAAYEYQGDATCAADGMCQEKCPVKINTGELIKSIRAEEIKASGTSRADALSMARPAAPNFSKCKPNTCAAPRPRWGASILAVPAALPPPSPCPGSASALLL